jgi:hypothetical protein
VLWNRAETGYGLPGRSLPPVWLFLFLFLQEKGFNALVAQAGEVEVVLDPVQEVRDAGGDPP